MNKAIQKSSKMNAFKFPEKVRFHILTQPIASFESLENANKSSEMAQPADLQSTENISLDITVEKK